MENAWSYQLKNGRIGTKNTLFYTPLKRAEIGQLCRQLRNNPNLGFLPVWRSHTKSGCFLAISLNKTLPNDLVVFESGKRCKRI